jgi:hypothetical protein
MKEVMAHHKGSLIFTVITMILGFGYGMYLFGNITQALGIVFIMGVLGVLEVSLSFDNAIVNAKTLEKMTPEWQHRFITWGMIIAVFGMRIVFPVLIVAIVSGLSMIDATMLAVNDHVKYSEILQSSHSLIAGFGGAFLFLVAFEFFFDAEKDVHWIHMIESKLVKLGARNGEVIPEWTVDGNLEPIEGAELHRVIDSEDSIVAIFDGEHFREVKK